jgi:hypothetical protein
VKLHLVHCASGGCCCTLVEIKARAAIFFINPCTCTYDTYTLLVNHNITDVFINIIHTSKASISIILIQLLHFIKASNSLPSRFFFKEQIKEKEKERALTLLLEIFFYSAQNTLGERLEGRASGQMPSRCLSGIVPGLDVPLVQRRLVCVLSAAWAGSLSFLLCTVVVLSLEAIIAHTASFVRQVR